MKKLLAFLSVMAITGLAAGCVVHHHGYVEYDGPVVEYGYEPILYDGYVVYYADGGIPFIWMNGVQFWIPVAHRSYYIDHYHQHRSAYHAWYQHRGAMYRGHRYADRSRDGRHLHNADDRNRNRDRDDRPVLHRADDRDRDDRPALRRADDRERQERPALHKAPQNRPQPKARPQPKPKPQPKAKPKLKKKDD
ncbi:MAG TPA: hypothetical protein PK668_10405 [Myxococcota bacterium]|nr:hypothetical protein [Myxococcota bacterium]HRY93426.1 hypothetical protein [Myxococcota bacterium]HSA22018.1 hypothetical protein [Myxococcota bacterium]